MALGDMSKALILMSKMKGWDPTVIPDTPKVAQPQVNANQGMDLVAQTPGAGWQSPQPSGNRGD